MGNKRKLLKRSKEASDHRAVARNLVMIKKHLQGDVFKLEKQRKDLAGLEGNTASEAYDDLGSALTMLEDTIKTIGYAISGIVKEGARRGG